MSSGTEQQITKKDLQALIEESNRHRSWGNIYKIAQIILTPLIITVVSMIVTCRINMQQAANTERITKIQIESAEIIAEANRQNSVKISESDQRIERLDHIKDIFKSFLKEDDDSKMLTDQEFEAHKLQIISLEVYKEDALLFLLNIREHYQTRLNLASPGSDEQKRYRQLRGQADKSIENILLNSQIDVSSRIFMDCREKSGSLSPGQGVGGCETFENEFKKSSFRQNLRKSILENQASIKGGAVKTESPIRDERAKLDFTEINLRQQEYRNFNFSNCSFIKANLYSSDFSSCTLNDAYFFDVDLQEATFSGSNLSGSIFRNSNLQKANFEESKLRRVIFVNPILNKRDADPAIKQFCKDNTCCELEGAQFSLGSLLWVAGPPFDVFDRENNKKAKTELRKEWLNLYINLLVHHRKSIALMVEAAEQGDVKEKKKLEILLKNTDTKNDRELIQLLENTADKNKILAKPDSPERYSSLTRQ